MKTRQTTEEKFTSIQIIRHTHVCQKLQISSAKLFDLIAKGLFPKPFSIIPGGRAVGWLEHDIDQWVLKRKATSNGKAVDCLGATHG
jgi:prophage regulatory protein